MHFWNISWFFLLSSWIPGMADLGLGNCKKWKQEFFNYPTYNCSISENSPFIFPLMPDKWTYVFWRANSSSAQVPILFIHNGVLQLFSSKFQGCSFSDGCLNLGKLEKSQEGEYLVKEKETIKALMLVHILPDQQSKRNRAVSAVPLLPISFLLLCCVLLKL